MSEVKLLGKKEDIVCSSPLGFESVGQILKYYRELKGLSLEEVSKRTYIKLKYLDSLEENHEDIMPAPVYVYSYIKHYAKLLGLEGGELVKLYQKQCNINDSSLPYNIEEKDNISTVKTSAAEDAFNKVSLEAELQQEKASVETRNILNKNTDKLNNNGIYLQNKNIIELNSKDINKDNGKTLMDLDAILDNNIAAKPVKTETNPDNAPLKQENPIVMSQTFENGRPEEKIISQEIINSTIEADRIIREAKKEAERIIKDAQEEAYELRHGAQNYADSVLKSMEQELVVSLNEIKNGRTFLRNKTL